MTAKKIIDAEFTDIDGTTKGGKRIFEQIADVAEHAADPLDSIPHAEAHRAAEKLRKVGEIARDVDMIVEESKPIARKVESAIDRMLKVVGLEDFSERDVLPRR